MKKEAIEITVVILLALALLQSSYAQMYFPETIVYGKVVDKNGYPIENEPITAEWSDAYGNHSAQTRTFTKTEADNANRPELWGSYLFNTQIKSPPGTKIKVRTEPKAIYEVVISTPGDAIEVEPMRIQGIEVTPQTEPEKEGPGLLNSALTWTIAALKKIAKPALVVLALIVAIYCGRLIYRKAGRITSLLRKRTASRGEYLVAKTKVKNVMTKNVVKIHDHAGIMETLEAMITRGINSIIIVSGKEPIGIISECDFLKKVYTRDKIEPLLASDIMSSPLKAIGPDASLYECIEFALKNNIRRVPVVSGKKLEGIITVSDILEQFHEFFLQNTIDGNLPIVQDIMAKDFTEMNDDARISDVLSYMIWKKTSFLVQKSDKPGKMITSSDALSQFYKSLNEMYKMKIKQISSQEIVFVSPFTDIIKALEMMKKNDYKRLPVVLENKVIGVVTQLLMLKGLHNFMRQVKSK